MARESGHEQDVLPLADRVRDRCVPKVVQPDRARKSGPVRVAPEDPRDHARAQRTAGWAHHAITTALALDGIAAEYRHTTARGVTARRAPDPQLHSHVVITGAIREDDRIVAVASRPVFRAARELGAFYRSALAEELAGEGYGIEQNTGKGGKYFEIEGVPRELCEGFSGRSREVARAAERFRARYGRAPERGELRNLALENRATKTLTTRPDLERAWRDTGYEHVFGADQAVRLIAFNEPQQHTRHAEDRIDPRRWPRVVVDFNDEPAWVVTALVQQNPPRGWTP
jgi:hypothetical protein